jgi:hypothetical protein
VGQIIDEILRPRAAAAGEQCQHQTARYLPP